jgi:hypothetical protein
MTVLAIDPGSEQSAWVLWDGGVWAHGKDLNDLMLHRIYAGYWGAAPVFSQDGPYTRPAAYVLEQIASYGMPVGAEVFETCVWTGRFIQQAEDMKPRGGHIDRLPRKDVKLHICGQTKAKDSNIRQALIDRFGGKEKAIGRKASKGPLYGIKADCWQALALAITWVDLHGGTLTEE